MARPCDYSPELTAVICARMAEGVSLRSICLADDMPDKATVFRWLAAYREFRDQCARARAARADAMAEEILEISDDDHDEAITDPESSATRSTANSSRARGSRSIPANG